MATLPSTLKEEPDLTGTLVHYAVLSLLGPAWYCCGQLAQRAKLPQITGYVIGGIICGPSGREHCYCDYNQANDEGRLRKAVDARLPQLTSGWLCVISSQ